MLKIALINMPFAVVQLPSIALTQLKAVIEHKFDDDVRVDTYYLNHDFALYLGMDPYKWIADSNESHSSGMGDWFFRPVAFPDENEKVEVYLRRYFPGRSEPWGRLKQSITQKRSELAPFIDDLISRYSLDQYDIVGFTSMFQQNVGIFAMARRIKERNREVVTVIGGANCETPMGQEIARNVSYIDYVFSGPGLVSFSEFVGCLLRGERSECARIKGVFDKTNNLPQPGSVIGEELDINAPVPLDYDPFLRAIENRFPGGEVEPSLLFETSRGCWWGEKAHCTFCGLNGQTMNYRAMDPAKAVDHISTLFKYSARCSRLESVDNILPKNYLTEVFPNLHTPSNMTLFYEVKADINEEEVAILARARVTTIQPGIESLASSTLRLMRKGTSAFTNLLLLKNCLKNNVVPAWNLLIGFPGEDEDVYRKYLSDLPNLTHLYPPTGVYPVRFDRYSPYFVDAKKYGLDLHPMDFYALVYPFNKEILANLAYYFVDRNLRAEYVKATSRWIGGIREAVNIWSKQWTDSNVGSHPQLCFTDNSGPGVILDSRSGSPIEHRVSGKARQLLEFLNKPRRMHEIVAELGATSEDETAEEMNALKERGLVFQEGDRCLSLVMSPHL